MSQAVVEMPDLVKVTVEEYTSLQMSDKTSEMRQRRKMWVYSQMYGSNPTTYLTIPKNLLPPNFIPSSQEPAAPAPLYG